MQSTESVDGRIVARIEERTRLYYSVTDRIDSCEYRLDHELTIAASNGRWVLADARATEEGGVPPITQFMSRPAVPDSSAGLAPARESTQVDLDSLRSGCGGGRTGRLGPGAINVDVAVQYAEDWAVTRNPMFPNYPDNDCTNFISQCMLIGGWPQVPGLNQRNWSNWFVQGSPDDCSFTWGGAEPWYQFAVNRAKRTYILDRISRLALGCVLQMDFNGNGEIDHSQIAHECAAVRPGTGAPTDWYMAQHSRDYRYRRLSEIIAQLAEEQPNCRYYAHDYIW
jgi:Putative amidase domain